MAISRLNSATWYYRKQAEVKPGEKCKMCGEPAAHKVRGSRGGYPVYHPVCRQHAEGATQHGYPVTPAL